MNERKLLCLLLLIGLGSATVFAQGKWSGENEVFNYGFESVSGGKKSKFSGGSALAQSISASDGEVGFLPVPSSGTAKVSIEPNTGASFSLAGKGANTKLKAVASSSKATEAAAASISKFSLYGIPSTAITALFFSLDINAFATEGQLVIPFGNTPTVAADNSNTFNEAKQMSEWWDAEHIFGAIKLDIYEGPWMAYSYRRARTGKKDSEAPRFVELKAPTPFTKGKSHKIELYCNNSAADQHYTRDGKSFTVSPQTYHWWVNGERVPLDKDDYQFPATGETAVGSAINSFSINTSGNGRPSPNTLEVVVSGISALSL